MSAFRLGIGVSVFLAAVVTIGHLRPELLDEVVVAAHNAVSDEPLVEAGGTGRLAVPPDAPPAVRVAEPPIRTVPPGPPGEAVLVRAE